MGPETAECGIGVAVIGAAADSVEGPAEPLKDGLPLPVCFPAIWAVVGVAVELDGQSAAPTLDHQVDAVAADLVLGLDAVPARDDPPEHIPLEVGVEGRL